MPTTQPLDDELGDIAEGPLKPIAGFAQPGNQPVGEPPRANVPAAKPAQVAVTQVAAARTDVAPPPPTTPRSPGAFTAMRGIRTPSANLAGFKPKANEQRQTALEQSPTPVQNREYADADVVDAWNSFIERNASLHLLTNAMRMVMPVRISGNNFRVAQSEIHISYISEHLGRITDYVRKQVSNDQVTFIPEIVTEDSPLAWTDRELLQNIIKDNNAVGDFVRNLGLNLL